MGRGSIENGYIVGWEGAESPAGFKTCKENVGQRGRDGRDVGEHHRFFTLG